MPGIERLLERNRAWAGAMVRRDARFFARLAEQQAPQYLWIGCSDSRVPANEIVDLAPGEVFVHRNVANVVVHTDLNCLSVMQFAVDVLKVRHIIVCGHYGCGGVDAALMNERHGLIDNWLRHVQDVQQQHESLFGGVDGQKARANLLCELNVIEQVSNVCRTSIVQDAWARGQALAVHGWIYGLHDGLLRDLNATASSVANAAAAYRAAIDRLAGAAAP